MSSSTNVVAFAWKRSIPGREAMSAQHFKDFSEWLESEQRNGRVQSFLPIIFEPHSGTVEGFFLLQGEPARLAELMDTPQWMEHQTRGLLHLDGLGVFRGVTGAALAQRMGQWASLIPK